MPRIFDLFILQFLVVVTMTFSLFAGIRRADNNSVCYFSWKISHLCHAIIHTSNKTICSESNGFITLPRVEFLEKGTFLVPGQFRSLFVDSAKRK